MAKKDEGYTEVAVPDAEVLGSPKERPYSEAITAAQRELLAAAGQLPA